MDHWVAPSLEYYGAAASTIAALIVAIDPGRRWMGLAMLIFVSSSLALMVWGFLVGNGKGIGWQNVGLLLINSYGVWRYLIAPARAASDLRASPRT